MNAPAQSPIAYAAEVVRLLSPSLAYARPNGVSHRAERAREMLERGAVHPLEGEGEFLVDSYSVQGRQHHIDLSDLSCTCDDHNRTGACWHLVAAAMFEAAAVRCPGCGVPMQYDARFAQRRVDGEKTFVGGHVCYDCEYTILDDGEVACSCDEAGHLCAIHRAAQEQSYLTRRPTPPRRQRATPKAVQQPAPVATLTHEAAMAEMRAKGGEWQVRSVSECHKCGGEWIQYGPLALDNCPHCGARGIPF